MADDALLGNWYHQPHGTPPFDNIALEHFEPAFEAAFAMHNDELAALTGSSDAPTFTNTVEALERSGERLGQVSAIFFALNGANGNAQMDAINKSVSPKLSDHYSKIFLDAELFTRVKAVWDQHASLGLTAEQERLLQTQYDAFVSNGANLDKSQKTRLQEIDNRLAVLRADFETKLKKDSETSTIFLDKPDQLRGLSEEHIAASASDATSLGKEGKWAIKLSNTPENVPFLLHGEDRALRKHVFEATVNLGQGGDYATQDIITEVLKLRQERAHLIDAKRYPTHAHYATRDRVVNSPEDLYAFMNKVRVPAQSAAKRELEALQTLFQKDHPGESIQPPDWLYYAEKLRAAKYDFDDSQLKPYFQLGDVRDGAFATAEKLFGLTFNARTDLPVYHPDVDTFDVVRDGQRVGTLYMDYFARSGKRGGAWMSEFRPQFRTTSGDMVTPSVYNVFNFQKPAPGRPALLTLTEVTTLFHELGHGLHGLLSNVTYPSLSGTNVSRDFVEMPSQIFEQWALQPDVLDSYARHYETRKPIPRELLERMQQSKRYGEGAATTRYLAAAYLDLDLHARDDAIGAGLKDFQKSALKRFGLDDALWARYQSWNFSHIFSSGYSAGYGSYIVSEMMDADAFALFKKRGLFDQKTAKAFEQLLASGNTKPPMELFENFVGRKPEPDALLERKFGE